MTFEEKLEELRKEIAKQDEEWAECSASLESADPNLRIAVSAECLDAMCITADRAPENTVAWHLRA